MTRSSKIHYANAFYHVMLRGNYKQNIFRETSDYYHFYTLLEKVITLYGCKIHLFCLMTNHVHMVLEIDYAPLGKIIQSIASPYARRMHKKNNVKGHLFEGRYLDKIILDEKYLLELCYYIHMNPLKAKMTTSLDLYPWSSHQTYRNIAPINWVSTDYVNSLLRRHVCGKNFYENFIFNREQSYTKPQFCQIDESGQLVINDSVNAKLNSADTLDLRCYSISEILDIVCNALSIPLKTVISEARHEELLIARGIAVYFAHFHAKYKLNQIAYYLNRNPASISKSLTRLLSSKKIKLKMEESIVFVRHKFEDDLHNKERTAI